MVWLIYNMSSPSFPKYSVLFLSRLLSSMQNRNWLNMDIIIHFCKSAQKLKPKGTQCWHQEAHPNGNTCWHLIGCFVSTWHQILRSFVSCSSKKVPNVDIRMQWVREMRCWRTAASSQPGAKSSTGHRFRHLFLTRPLHQQGNSHMHQPHYLQDWMIIHKWSAHWCPYFYILCLRL